MTFEICKDILVDGFSGNLTEFISQCPMASSFAGGALGGLVAIGIALAILFLIGLYVYTSIVWQTIAKKLKHKKSWLAWIPIVRCALILQLGKFHWAWVFLVLIPIFGWIVLIILIIISKWRIFEKRKYPGWFSLAPLLPKIGGIVNLIALGFLAWKDRKKRLTI